VVLLYHYSEPPVIPTAVRTHKEFRLFVCGQSKPGDIIVILLMKEDKHLGSAVADAHGHVQLVAQHSGTITTARRVLVGLELRTT